MGVSLMTRDEYGTVCGIWPLGAAQFLAYDDNILCNIQMMIRSMHCCCAARSPSVLAAVPKSWGHDSRVPSTDVLRHAHDHLGTIAIFQDLLRGSQFPLPQAHSASVFSLSSS